MMLRLLKRNPLQWISLHQISQTQLPFLPPNLITNGNLANAQVKTSPFAVFYFSSAASQESPKTEEPLLDFFHSYGFTDTQIKRFLYTYVKVRYIGTIRPKLEHLLAFGFSPSELIKVICNDPNLLVTSLKEKIEPNLNLLEASFGSKDHIRKAIVNCPGLLRHNLEKRVIPNLKILRENSIPMDKITHLFATYPLVLLKDPNLIIETVTKLKGLGMKPSTLAFIHGMSGMTTMKKETWERKMELYRSFGWSEEDMLLAFSRQPICVQLSEEKIKKQMKFLNEKLRWDSAMVLRWPVVLTLSLEKRLIPRCAVLSVMAKNGLWNGKPNLYSLLTMAEKNFKERFVEKYEKDVPEVIDAYQGKVDFVGFESMDVESLNS